MVKSTQPLTPEQASDALVAILKPFQILAPTEDEPSEYDKDAKVREIVRTAMRKLDVYDAYGCPLCLS